MKSTLSVCLNLAILTGERLRQRAHTHGGTYAEAIQHGEEVLELLIEEYQSQGRMLPTPIAAETPIEIGIAT